MESTGCSSPKARESTREKPQSGHVARLTDAFNWLKKLLRAMDMYAEDHAIIKTFQASAGQYFRTLTEELGETWVEIGAKSITLGETVVYQEDPKDDSFVYQLYRDGIRRISLLPGLEQAEIERFARVLATNLDDPTFFDSDTVTLLWDADLQHIRYIIAEMLSESIDESEELQYYKELMEGIIESAMNIELQPGTAPQSNAELIRVNVKALAELSPEKIAAAMAMVDPAGRVDMDHAPNEDAMLAALQKEYEDPTALSKFVEILYRGMLQSREEAPRHLSTFDLLIKALIQKARYEDILRVLRLIRELEEKSVLTSAEPLKKMASCLLRSDRALLMISRLDHEDLDGDSILEILRMLPPEGCADILKGGAEISNKTNWQKLVDILAQLAVERLDIFVSQLSSASLAEAQMGFQALRAIGTPAALEAMIALGRHPSQDLRLAVLRTTRDLQSSAMRALRIDLLNDQHALVRAEAEHCLATHRDPALIERLQERIRDNTFKGCSFEEKCRVCTMLGRIGTKEDRKVLYTLFSERRLLGGKAQAEQRAAAAYGLGASGKKIYAQVLQGEVERRLGDKLVKTACREALKLLEQPRRSSTHPAHPSMERDRSTVASAQAAGTLTGSSSPLAAVRGSLNSTTGPARPEAGLTSHPLRPAPQTGSNTSPLQSGDAASQHAGSSAGTISHAYSTVESRPEVPPLSPLIGSEVAIPADRSPRSGGSSFTGNSPPGTSRSDALALLDDQPPLRFFDNDAFGVIDLEPGAHAVSSENAPAPALQIDGFLHSFLEAESTLDPGASDENMHPAWAEGGAGEELALELLEERISPQSDPLFPELGAELAQCGAEPPRQKHQLTEVDELFRSYLSDEKVK